MSKLQFKDIKETGTPGHKRDPGDPSIYIPLEEGSNYVRIAEEDFCGVMMYYAYGRFQKSADPYGAAESICPLAKERDEKGDFYKARPYFLFKAFDRRTGKIGILRVGKQLTLLMKKRAAHKSLGPLTQYDICIEKGPKGAQPLYDVIPEPKTPFTDEELAMIAADKIDLEQAAKPAKVEWVNEFIEKNKANAQKTRGNAPAATTEKPRNTSTKRAPKEEPEVNNEFVGKTEVSNEFDDDFENI
jgi:hypothetical protein